MVKKLKPDELIIKELLMKGYRQCEISHLLSIKKRKRKLLDQAWIKNLAKEEKKYWKIYLLILIINEQITK